MDRAQKLIGHAAGSPEAMDSAMARAEALVRTFYEPPGRDIRVAWGE
jgi:hypothetical protein